MPLPLFQNSKDQKTLLEGNLGGVKAVIGVVAGKGGVGKSTVTVNLALALQAKGYSVGVMDTDIYGPSIRRMLPEDRLPSQKGEWVQPALCHGIKVITIAYFRKEGEAAAVRAPIANRFISFFLRNIQWGNLDYLLVDFPPGTGDIHLTLCQQAQLSGVIVVTTPQEVALMDVRKSVSLFEQVKVPIVGIIENMSYYQAEEKDEPVFIFGQGGGKKLASEVGAPFLGCVPLDPVVCSLLDAGKSLFSADPNSLRPSTRAFENLAQKVQCHADSLKAEREQGVGSFELVWKEMHT